MKKVIIFNLLIIFLISAVSYIKKDEDDKNTVLYLHVFDWPNDGKLVVPGLQNEVVEAYALNDKSKTELDVEKNGDKTITVDVNNVGQSKYATVIVLEIEGKPVVKK